MTVKITWKAEKWHKAPLLCRIFGHSSYSMYGAYYVDPEFHAVDNVGTAHLDLKLTCDHCGHRGTVAKVHLQSVLGEMERTYKRHPHIRSFVKPISS